MLVAVRVPVRVLILMLALMLALMSDQAPIPAAEKLARVKTLAESQAANLLNRTKYRVRYRTLVQHRRSCFQPQLPEQTQPHPAPAPAPLVVELVVGPALGLVEIGFLSNGSSHNP